MAKCFDTVNHDVLMNLLGKTIAEKRVLNSMTGHGLLEPDNTNSYQHLKNVGPQWGAGNFSWAALPAGREGRLPRSPVIFRHHASRLHERNTPRSFLEKAIPTRITRFYQIVCRYFAELAT